MVPAKARACPECGADENTGWSDRAQAQRLGIPDDDFDYEGFAREEFGEERRRNPAERVKPPGMRWLWWVVAVVLVLAFAYSYLIRAF